MISKTAFQVTIDELCRPLQAYLDDPAVSEILINGPRTVYVEKEGKLQQAPCALENAGLMAFLRVVAQFAGRHLDQENPILEARLPDGSRVEAVLSPIAANGPCIAIRRHKTACLGINRLVELGSLSGEAVETLRPLIQEKHNLLVSGGTGSGKTALLNAFASLVNDDERVLVLEDARELQLQQRHVVSLEARAADPRGRGKVTLFNLFRASLRMRPDRIVIGEIRGEEALDLVQAMTSGHGGCMSTIHASSPLDALRRLETLALMRGLQLPLEALREQVASAIHLIVQVERFVSGRRGVTEIARVNGLNEDRSYRTETIFHRGQDGKLERSR